MSFSKRYNQLNKQQKLAVDSVEGSVLVIAGPGSGKTELLGLRTANIIKKTDTPIGSVLNLTFTNAATNNMKQRLVDVIGEEGYRSSVYTFHSFCSNIIENYPDLFFKGVRFSPADQLKKIEIIKNILDDFSFDDPLCVKHPSFGYVFLKDIEKSILTLQEEGLSPDAFSLIVNENEKQLPIINKLIQNIFTERVSKKTSQIINNNISKEDLFHSDAISARSLLATTVRSITSLAHEEDTKKLSQWKQRMTRRSDCGLVLKDFFNIEKMKSLTKIYSIFQQRMTDEGYYSFSDMILEVIDTLRKNSSLLSDLQEKYLYIQADEFQDTNGAQMQLLKLLTSNIDNPNICAVGDDDQTIYRFQGADISNILDFKKIYPQSKIITLVKNYRSNSKIVGTAKAVIDQSEERITTLIKGIDKNITSAKESCDGIVSAVELKTEQEEFSFVAQKIKKELEKTSPDEIAVIARTNHELQKITPYLVAENIPYHSERKENIIGERHILEIINIIKFAVSAQKKDNSGAIELLPEIMGYPFFAISRTTIWDALNEHYNSGKDLIKVINDNKETRDVASLLLEIATQSSVLPAENLIDIIIGNEEVKISGKKICSPFKEYYFSGNINKEYIRLFSSLQCLIGSVREHQRKKTIKGADIVSLVDFCEENNTPIINKDPLVSRNDAVQLITAHGAKGREFETVFVINCQQKKWAGGGRADKISLPMNIPAKNSGSSDDQIRLFYVAITRAKKNLYFTFHNFHSNGERNLRLDFLSQVQMTEYTPRLTVPNLIRDTFSEAVVPPQTSEKNFLSAVVEDYRLSATAFNKFLNVADAGPTAFVKDSLLRFPHAKNIYASYGTAVHNTIQETYNILKKESVVVTKKRFIKIFTDFLKKERLPDRDFLNLSKKGEEELSYYYTKKKKEFFHHHIVEKNFNNQGVVVGDTALTGKIDKIVIDKEKKELFVYDVKTGEPFLDWKGRGDREKLKAWQYRNQLIFYKILTERSRDFSNYKTTTGFLEFVKRSKKREIITLSYSFEQAEVERVLSLIKVVGRMIKELDFPTTDIYKKNMQGVLDFEDDLLGKDYYD